MAADLLTGGQAGLGFGSMSPSWWVQYGGKQRKVATNDTNGILIKGAKALLMTVTITNTAAAARFVKTYDKATAPTVGTDTPNTTYGLAAGASQTFNYAPLGIPFALGLGFGITNLAADSDTTAPTAGDVIVDFVFL